MQEQIKKFQRIQVPPRHLAAIAGYGGVIPHKQSSNIIGVSYQRAKGIAADITEKSKN